MLVLETYLNWWVKSSFLVNQRSREIKGMLVSVTYLNIEQEVCGYGECSLQDNHTPHLGALRSQVKHSSEGAVGP